MKRDAASTIFRTVVFAGAMLGAGACGGKKTQTTTPTTPGNTAKPDGDAKMENGGTTPDMKPDDHAGGDPCGSDPCGGGERPRGSDDDGGGGTGRGFILS